MKKITMVSIVILLSMQLSGCGVIQDGNVGVRHTMGKISDNPEGAGIFFFMPFFQQMEHWNVKTRQVTETAGVPSNEGLISNIDVTLLYRVTGDNSPKIRKKIGKSFEKIVIKPYFREAIRNIASGFAVKALYSDTGRAKIQQGIKELLVSKLQARGIIVEDVLIRNIVLPKTFTASIERKLKSEQEALQKEFELQKAVKDAEIEVAKAEGVANANKIIAESITENYLRYKFIEGLNEGNSEVIYVPTEANLPILEAREKRIHAN